MSKQTGEKNNRVQFPHTFVMYLPNKPQQAKTLSDKLRFPTAWRIAKN